MTTTPAHERPRGAARAAEAARAQRADALALRVVVAVSIAYAALVGALSILRYESFASDFDHGIFSQYVWLLGHLHEPFNTINLRDLLGDHVEPGLISLAPLGTIGAGAVGLLVVQALALAATAPLLYLLARALGADGWVAVVPAVLWCVSPVVLRVALHDFHPESLVPVALVGGCLALVRGRTAVFLLTAVVACSLKEDVGLTYAALGLVLAWTGRKRLGAAVAVAATVWAAVAVYVVLPAFGNAAEDEFGPRFAGDRGDSFADVLRFAVVHPLTTVSQLATPNDIGILVMLVALCGGLCLLAPRWLVVAVPATALNLLSAYDLQHTIEYHYWIVPAGAVAVAGAYGAARVPAEAARRWLGIAASTAVVTLLLSLQWVSAITGQIRAEWPHRADREAVLAAIPAGASVAAPMHALSHLSERRTLYVLPEPLVPVRVGTEWGAGERRRATRGLEYVVYDPAMRFWGSLTDQEVEAAIVRNGFHEVLRRGETRLYRKEPQR